MRRRLLASTLAATALLAAACGSSGTKRSATTAPASSTSTSAPSQSPGPVNYSANGHPVYGSTGPEGVPLEAGPSLPQPSPTVTGQTVDGISCNTNEQLAYHHHVHLIVFVNGVAQALPLGIGIMPQVEIQQSQYGPFAAGSTKCFYWLHVHATDGIIHIEAPQQETFTLGQAFAVYGQPLSSTAVAGATGAVTATVNGKPFTGDPSTIPLNEHDQIVLNVGGPAVSPPPINWSITQL